MYVFVVVVVGVDKRERNDNKGEYIFQYSNKGNYWGFNFDDDNHNNDDLGLEEI